MVIFMSAWICENKLLSLVVDVVKSDDGSVANFVVDGTAVTTFNVNTDVVDVIVTTQGIQASGFGDAKTAVDSAFPHNPWYVAPTNP